MLGSAPLGTVLQHSPQAEDKRDCREIFLNFSLLAISILICPWPMHVKLFILFLPSFLVISLWQGNEILASSVGFCNCSEVQAWQTAYSGGPSIMADILYKWKQEGGKPVREGDVITEADIGVVPSWEKGFPAASGSGKSHGTVASLEPPEGYSSSTLRLCPCWAHCRVFHLQICKWINL